MKKGPLFEATIVGYLRLHGFPRAERRVMGGSGDRGDVAGVETLQGDWCLELKNCKTMSLGPWMDEAEKESANADARFYAVVHKRARKGDPAEQFVTMPLSVFTALLTVEGATA